jgi:DNA mismatch repair protein MutL
MPIRRLPPDVASKIAAGEVVERPASVVKELMENALDAGATEIHIEVRGGGQQLIKVNDNGSGIPADEVELAFEHHATSKVQSADDLFALQTLGFRGEALPSIAAVSHVTILTRTRHDTVGVQMRMEGRTRVAQEQRAAPAGTILSVEELFYNVPARRKFLRTTATENGAIAEIVSTYALAYPDHRFSLSLDGRQVVQTNGSGKLSDAIVAVYGVEVVRQMIDLPLVEDDAHGIQLDGYIGGPALSRPNRKFITLFVNGRAIKSQILLAAIQQAYQGVVPTGRFPVVVLRLTVPPDMIDVNVHPQKMDVKFARSDELFGLVQKVIRRRLIEASPVHRLMRGVEAIGDVESGESGTQEAESGKPKAENDTGDWMDGRYTGTGGRGELGLPPEPQPPTHPGHRRGAEYWEERTERQPSPFTPPQTGDFTAYPTDGGQMEMPLPPPPGAGYTDERGGTKLPPLRVLGQIHKTYLICEGPDGLYLIDQHTAHERVLLERFQKERARTAVPSQKLLSPLGLELTPQQVALVEEQQDVLLRLGFEVEPFGGLMVMVRAMPTVLQNHPDPAAALAEVLDGAIRDRSGLSWEERIVMYAACRGAVKAGDDLTLEEMRDLIRQLEQCNLARTCAHGRPTVVRLSQAQLEREFGRR